MKWIRFLKSDKPNKIINLDKVTEFFPQEYNVFNGNKTGIFKYAIVFYFNGEMQTQVVFEDEKIRDFEFNRLISNLYFTLGEEQSLTRSENV